MGKPEIMSFGLTPEQHEIVLRRMAISGETNKSAHFRRVYFESDISNDKLIGKLTKQIEILTGAVEDNQKLLRKLSSGNSEDLELKVLAGLYLMLYRSTDSANRAVADQYLDVSAIESFLNDSGAKRRIR